MNQKRKKVEYIVVPLLSVLFMALMVFVAGDNLIGNFYGQWKSIFIAGQVAYVENPLESLAKEDVKETSEYQVGEGLRKGKEYGTIYCEERSLYAPLYYGDTEEILEKGVGTYEGLGVPGEGGSILTGAHDVTFYAPLEQIKLGDVITVETYWGTYQYEVKDMKVEKISEDMKYESRQGETLIMYTCYPFGEDSQERLERYFVYAEKMEEENR